MNFPPFSWKSCLLRIIEKPLAASSFFIEKPRESLRFAKPQATSQFKLTEIDDYGLFFEDLRRKLGRNSSSFPCMAWHQRPSSDARHPGPGEGAWLAQSEQRQSSKYLQRFHQASSSKSQISISSNSEKLAYDEKCFRCWFFFFRCHFLWKREFSEIVKLANWRIERIASRRNASF